jgi:hypothetical protein
MSVIRISGFCLKWRKMQEKTMSLLTYKQGLKELKNKLFCFEWLISCFATSLISQNLPWAFVKILLQMPKMTLTLPWRIFDLRKLPFCLWLPKKNTIVSDTYAWRVNIQNVLYNYGNSGYYYNPLHFHVTRYVLRQSLHTCITFNLLPLCMRHLYSICIHQQPIFSTLLRI